MSSSPDFHRQALELLAAEFASRGWPTAAKEEILSGFVPSPRDQAALAVIARVLEQAHHRALGEAAGMEIIGFMDEGQACVLPVADSCVLSLNVVLSRDAYDDRRYPVYVPASSCPGRVRPPASLAPESIPAGPQREQDAFEEWARSAGFDMSQHPLHWLFLHEETYAARQGWKEGLVYVSGLPDSQVVSSVEVEAFHAWSAKAHDSAFDRGGGDTARRVQAARKGWVAALGFATTRPQVEGA